MASTMVAITAPKYTDPSGYALSNLPIPTISGPKDVVVHVHAASINPVDVKIVAGAMKMALPETFPLKIGYDCAGIVTEIGRDVKRLRVGDEVWSRLPEASKGAWGEYVKSTEDHIALKPSTLSFAEAASLPLAGITAMQALQRYNGSLVGKTVLVPAGLSGTGAYACQLAKNVFGAGKVITTVSTAKVDKVPHYLGEGVVDQIIDYTKEDPKNVIAPRSIDFFFDTMGDAMPYLSLMTPGTSTIISVSTTPSGTQFQQSSFFNRPSKPKLPWYALGFLNTADWVRKYRAKRWGVEYSYMFLKSNAEQLDILKSHVEEGKIKPVIGARGNLRDIEKVRELCLQTHHGKGGLGKTVFDVITD